MSNENSVRGAAMDAITALQRLLVLLEGQGIGYEVTPIYEPVSPTTINVKCECGQRIYYGDKFCSECGGKIKW